MLTKALARYVFLETVLASGLMLVSSGCGGNDNEREFARTAAPGIPSDRPNESVRRPQGSDQNRHEVRAKTRRPQQGGRGKESCG